MREEIKLWWEQANHDLETAKILLQNKRLDAASFYFQQSLEKALKAYILLVKKESPGPIHSLIKLASIAGIPKKFHSFLRKLSAEYYLSRYPDAVEDTPYKTYMEEEVKEYAKNTSEVVAWLNTLMKE